MRIYWVSLCIMLYVGQIALANRGLQMSNTAVLKCGVDALQWEVWRDGKLLDAFDYCDLAIRYAVGLSLNVTAGAGLSFQQLGQLIGAAVFAGVTIYDVQGEVLPVTPINEASVRYLTRGDIGNILPEGWMIEQQLGRYAACYGEELTFPYRKSMMLAIADIRAFLAASALQASQELAQSLAAELVQSEMRLN